MKPDKHIATHENDDTTTIEVAIHPAIPSLRANGTATNQMTSVKHKAHNVGVTGRVMGEVITSIRRDSGTAKQICGVRDYTQDR